MEEHDGLEVGITIGTDETEKEGEEDEEDEQGGNSESVGMVNDSLSRSIVRSSETSSLY